MVITPLPTREGLGGGSFYEYLLDVRLHLPCTNAQHFGAGGDAAQVHQLQSFALYLLYHHREDFLLHFFVFWQEHKPRSVPAFLGHRNALQQNEFVRNLHHDAGTVARLVARLGTAMLHVLQHLQRIIDQLVALAAMNVDHHSHATSIVLVTALI